MGAEHVPVTTGTRPERAGTTRGPGLLVAEGAVSQWISRTRTSVTARYGAGTSTGTPIATSRAALNPPYSSQKPGGTVTGLQPPTVITGGPQAVTVPSG
jgi:hypothetical protein